MVRLIDADELIEYLTDAYDAGCVDPYTNQQRRAIFDEVLECVDNQPTLDAVPIAWILKWKEKFENAYSDEYDPTVAEMLVDMLEDWREEND